MSVPLDRLYNYLCDIVNDDIIIYHWYPHGSKKIEDLAPFKAYSYEQFLKLPPIVFHDQEPLEYYQWSQTDFEKYVDMIKNHDFCGDGQDQHLVNLSKVYQEQIEYYLTKGEIQDLPSAVGSLDLKLHVRLSQYDKILLAHSEVNSKELSKYQTAGFIPVYYWSHGIIARDWFRYAEKDPALNSKKIQFDFLIYNRAWSGTREYRLYFTQGLVKNNLHSHSLTSFSTHDQDIHYREHRFCNKQFQITNFELENYLPKNTYSSSASADYSSDDYNITGIEVVLETLFDDSRWHLTEKILRPIACGQPFMLVSTKGSLEYLRSYGFETFNDLIDETYDTIADPVQRLHAVLSEMKRISNLSSGEKKQLWEKLNNIAARNRKRFFSNEFHQQIINEYLDNLNLAMQEIRSHKQGKRWSSCWESFKNHQPESFAKYESCYQLEKQILGF